MTKVFPKGTWDEKETSSSILILTVWKKSMLFNCDGFTVFDGNGNLVYRVDNYNNNNKKSQILLMDAAGNPLFTIRRKMRWGSSRWLVFEGETAVNPIYSVRKKLKSKCLAEVTNCGSESKSDNNNNNNNNNKMMLYEIEGCYKKRCCLVYDDKRRIVAEIKRKEAVAVAGGGITFSFGFDVFHLIVHPQLDTALAMSLVILLDHMFSSI